MGCARGTLSNRPAKSSRLLAKITDAALPCLPSSHDLRSVCHFEQSIMKTAISGRLLSKWRVAHPAHAADANERSHLKKRRDEVACHSFSYGNRERSMSQQVRRLTSIVRETGIATTITSLCHNIAV